MSFRPFNNVASEVGKAVAGQDDVVELCLCALCAGGHVLLEGPPGCGKTLLAKSLAGALDLSFGRVSATEDLCAQDILCVGGPIFANVVLVDEVNRAPPKLQSALFEAMAEQQVTQKHATIALPIPHIVIASMNPHDHFSTHALCRPHLDRFLFRTGMCDLSKEIELSLMDGSMGGEKPEPVMDEVQIRGHMQGCAQVKVPENVLALCHRIVCATRYSRQAIEGASVRCAISYVGAVRGLAYMRGRQVARSQDAYDVAIPAIAHRILMCPDSQGFGYGADELVADIVRREGGC